MDILFCQNASMGAVYKLTTQLSSQLGDPGPKVIVAFSSSWMWFSSVQCRIMYMYKSFYWLEFNIVFSFQITNVLEEPPSSRTSLNIKVAAPVIYVPENSHSVNALIVDLGSLDFVNRFVLHPNSSVVLEESTITLNNLRVSR